MARADDIYEQFKGQAVEVEDSTNPFQCMDWAFKYCDLIGIPHSAIRRLHARQVWEQPTDESRRYFDYVANAPAYIAPAGALAIFGTAVGPSGHIAPVLSGSTRNLLVTADQNWNGHRYVEKVNHTNYHGVIGFLVPRSVNVPGIVTNNAGTYEAVRPAAVRIAPNHFSNLGGSKLLQPGARFVAAGVVAGENVGGNNQWVKSQLGNFVWSGNLRKV